MIKTSLTHDANLAWPFCRQCGIEFYAPASGCPSTDRNAMARRFGFCSVAHVGAYVREIKALDAVFSR